MKKKNERKKAFKLNNIINKVTTRKKKKNWVKTIQFGNKKIKQPITYNRNAYIYVKKK
jgi:hypothetical protein